MFTMSNNDKNETESPAIIEEIIPGKNNDKTINPSSNNNNQKPIIENYNEEDSAQAVIEATEEPKKSIEKIMTEAKNQSTPQYNNQSIAAAAAAGSQEQTSQTSQTSRDITNNYLELQKEAIDSFQSAFIPYFQNTQNQFWNNQGYFKSISEMYSRLANNYIESAMALSRMWSDVMSSNMNFLKNANNSSSPSTSSTSSSVANASTKSNFEIDSGKNSDESSTNVKATFSCETCGQTFDSRQDLKEHTSITHYHTRDK
jgi:hypothetical protein